jgi:hypothetical protein
MTGGGTVRPTKRQQELLIYIEQFIHEHGYSPSYREIMNGCKYTSVATVALHVGNLIKRGHLRKRDRSARSIEVVKASDTPPVVIKPSAMLAAASGEEWLLEQTEYHIYQAEQAAKCSQVTLDNIHSLLRACSILHVTARADELSGRFEALKARQ